MQYTELDTNAYLKTYLAELELLHFQLTYVPEVVSTHTPDQLPALEIHIGKLRDLITSLS